MHPSVCVTHTVTYWFRGVHQHIYINLYLCRTTSFRLTSGGFQSKVIIVLPVRRSFEMWSTTAETGDRLGFYASQEQKCIAPIKYKAALKKGSLLLAYLSESLMQRKNVFPMKFVFTLHFNQAQCKHWMPCKYIQCHVGTTIWYSRFLLITFNSETWCVFLLMV